MASLKERQGRRRIAIRLARAIRGAENSYILALRRAVGAAHAKYQAAALKVHVSEKAPGGLTRQDVGWEQPPRQDSLSFLDEDFDEIDEEVAAELASQVSAAYDRMAARLSAANKAALIEQGVAIDLRKDKHLALKMAAARDANIQLVEKARREYAESVREIFDDPDVYGKTPKELTELLMERGDVWKSRASLIARDQTLKLNSAITKERHQNAGITEYIWSTSQDSRVRPEHADLEGTQHSWDVPPEPGHPGEDFQCRCCAIPIFPVTDDGKEDQEEEGEED